jgi:hypothetical protein
MVSYEVALGLSLIPVFMLAGNVTLTEIVWQQQQLGMWYVFPLSLAFILFVISAFAETNRLPFDLPEAESELVTGYHTEYSAMKFSMFMIAEFSHILTASALMATLFLGGWSIPFWSGDHMFWHEGMLISGFAADGGHPCWRLPGPLDHPPHLPELRGEDGLLRPGLHVGAVDPPALPVRPGHAPGVEGDAPGGLAYVMIVAATILVLDQVGITGFAFGAILTLVSLVCTGVFVFAMDRDRIISGSPGTQNEGPACARPPRARPGFAPSSRPAPRRQRPRS